MHGLNCCYTVTACKHTHIYIYIFMMLCILCSFFSQFVCIWGIGERPRLSCTSLTMGTVNRPKIFSNKYSPTASLLEFLSIIRICRSFYLVSDATVSAVSSVATVIWIFHSNLSMYLHNVDTFLLYTSMYSFRMKMHHSNAMRHFYWDANDRLCQANQPTNQIFHWPFTMTHFVNGRRSSVYGIVIDTKKLPSAMPRMHELHFACETVNVQNGAK